MNHITPYLEPQGSGISALWARTTALKYNTSVAVGYPERVDVSPKWPTGPEYYNSTIMVNGDGETVAHYRKSFLYVIDETWALEGKDGFFADEIPGLGTVAMGICKSLRHQILLYSRPLTDNGHRHGSEVRTSNSAPGWTSRTSYEILIRFCSPYKFEAPWHAFELAFHIVSVEANVVIISMAWVTREDGRKFSRMPEEPDMETLTYWCVHPGLTCLSCPCPILVPCVPDMASR